MGKIVFILKGDKNEPVARFRQRVVDRFLPEILGNGDRRCKLTMTAVDPPRLSITPYKKERLAMISLWEASPSRESQRVNRACRAWDGPCHGYRVNETIPLAYERTWPAGTETPGLGLLTLFRSRQGLEKDEFLRRWHDGHSPLGMEVHPLWNYVRNVVQDQLVPGSPRCDGIVEEHCRTPQELLNPVRFFGGPLRMIPNMARIGLDIRKWMDFGSIENYLVSEQWIRG